MANSVKKYKTVFLGKWSKPCNSPKISSLSWSFLKICFEVCEKPKSNHLSHGILVEGFIMPNVVDEYKTIFLGKRVKPWKLCSYIGVSYRFVLKSAKDQNGIF